MVHTLHGMCTLSKNEPPHEKKPTKWLWAHWRLRSAWASAQSDQSSLSASRKLGSLATHWAHSEDSDQTGRMPRLIRVFTGHTHFVGFIMRWLKCWLLESSLEVIQAGVDMQHRDYHFLTRKFLKSSNVVYFCNCDVKKICIYFVFSFLFNNRVTEATFELPGISENY